MTTPPPATPAPEKVHIVWLVPAVVDGLMSVHHIDSEEALAAARLAQDFHTELETLLARRLAGARLLGLESRETAAQAFVCAAWAKAIEMGAQPQLFTQTMLVLESSMPRAPKVTATSEEPTPLPASAKEGDGAGTYCWCLKCGAKGGTWLIRDGKMICRETPNGEPCGGIVKTVDDKE